MLPISSLSIVSPEFRILQTSYGKMEHGLSQPLGGPVTPCRDSPGPTVRDACGRTRGSAAPGGDVSGTDQIAVSRVPAVRAAEATSLRLGDRPVALRAGGRRPPLVHLNDGDAGQLGLVGQA